MSEMSGAVTLRLYRNLSGNLLEWVSANGRKFSLAAGRGGSFAPDSAIAELVRSGRLEEVIQKRSGPGALPWSTDRRMP